MIRANCGKECSSPAGDRWVTRNCPDSASITAMNPVHAGLERVRGLLRQDSAPTCFVCRRPILPPEERLRLRGETVVHRRCATYRLRTRRSADSRLGFPT
jgi:hypothetical protein